MGFKLPVPIKEAVPTEGVGCPFLGSIVESLVLKYKRMYVLVNN